MKTAISIPDPVFDEAETLAQQLGVSRSELYVRAIEAMLEKHRARSVTAALDTIYASESASVDSQLMEMQMATLSQDEWE